MSCRTPSFCCFYTSKNRQDKRKEPKGPSARARERERERDKAREIKSVNRKGVFGLVFLLRGRCCCRGELVFWETTRLLVWENGLTLPSLAKKMWNITHKSYFYSESCTYLWMYVCVCVCVGMLLTAAGLVVKTRGHQKALLGCSCRQSPLVWRKYWDH